MAARKRARRKSARRAAKAKPRAKKRAGHNKSAAKKTSKHVAKKRAQPQRTGTNATRARTRRRPAAPSTIAVLVRAEVPERGHAQSLALLASEPVRVGVVANWFPRSGAIELFLEAPLSAGERIHVRGATSDFLARADSLRVRGVGVARAEPGAATLALPQRARPGDIVYALRPPA
jgi:hypothetical protein